MSISRRAFIQRSAAFGLGFAGLHAAAARGGVARLLSDAPVGFGPLVPDPNGIFDLPRGFTYRVISRVGEPMGDGLLTPGYPDAMAAFPGADGRTIIVRNHEVDRGRGGEPWGPDYALAGKVDRARIFDFGHGKPIGGGTTTIVYDTRTGRTERVFMSLAGTERNCAGGPTPRGTWITCEETVALPGEVHEKAHGWCFEVPADASEGAGLVEPVPLKAMGRFNHEACCTDPRTGIVYMTEDRHDGLLYRFLPADRDRLASGGRLQALAVQGRDGFDTRNWDEPGKVKQGERLRCRWIDVEDVESPDDSLRFQGYAKGAARFARGEGMWWGAVSDSRPGVFFACTNGGEARCGQIWRYSPDAMEMVHPPGGTLELFLESSDPGVLENADNLTVSPYGHLVVCEDGSEEQFLVGVSPRGEVYRIGRNAVSGSELAGACFSPDGSTLFVNIQYDGLTLAVTGPWPKG